MGSSLLIKKSHMNANLIFLQIWHAWGYNFLRSLGLCECTYFHGLRLFLTGGQTRFKLIGVGCVLCRFVVVFNWTEKLLFMVLLNFMFTGPRFLCAWRSLPHWGSELVWWYYYYFFRVQIMKNFHMASLKQHTFCAWYLFYSSIFRIISSWTDFRPTRRKAMLIWDFNGETN